MCIEERINQLEDETKKLKDEVEYLNCVNHDKWVSAKELAEIMGCSVNNIYIKIRSGEIYATTKLGSIPRIPMSQFYDNKVMTMKKSKLQNTQLSIKERVFGIGT